MLSYALPVEMPMPMAPAPAAIPVTIAAAMAFEPVESVASAGLSSAAAAYTDVQKPNVSLKIEIYNDIMVQCFK
jgi:hypothetical protein